MKHGLTEGQAKALEVIIRQDKKIDDLEDKLDKAEWLLKRWMKDVTDLDLEVAAETIKYLKG